jgi:hypothetical protein
MADIDLTGPVADALKEALLRERPVLVAAVDQDGNPQQSLRGSVYVYSKDQIAIWARKRDDGLAVDVTKHPNVSIFYFDPSTSPRMLQIKGRAHVEDSLSDEVYNGMLERERGRDPEKKGVAVIVDVDWATGAGEDGRWTQSR